eukprot:10833948-Heterocapsa_arctica.AAC.1
MLSTAAEDGRIRQGRLWQRWVTTVRLCVGPGGLLPFVALMHVPLRRDLLLVKLAAEKAHQ